MRTRETKSDGEFLEASGRGKGYKIYQNGFSTWLIFGRSLVGSRYHCSIEEMG